MKVSFPYMGCVTGYKRIMELLGHEVIMPEKPTQRTVDLGVLYSPEFICYPFKIMMGTYIEACEKGVEMIISSGGSGPCRAGLYCEIHRKVLKQLGYDVELVIFDSIFKDFKGFMRKLMMVKNKTPLVKVIRHVIFTAKLIKQMDTFEKEIKIKRAYEKKKDDFNNAWKKIVKMYEGCSTFRDLRVAKETARKMLDEIPLRQVPEEKKLRIGIVGEIYVIMESSTNAEIEQRLNDLGVEVVNVQCISDWLGHQIVPKSAPRWMKRGEEWIAVEKSKKYKTCACGGHALENTGWIMEFADKGFDGVVHLMPFGCLPELVTRSILPALHEDNGMPVLSISLDEQLGEANLQTRVEAFVDLCRNMKGNKARPSQEKKTEDLQAV